MVKEGRQGRSATSSPPVRQLSKSFTAGFAATLRHKTGVEWIWNGACVEVVGSMARVARVKVRPGAVEAPWSVAKVARPGARLRDFLHFKALRRCLHPKGAEP